VTYGQQTGDGKWLEASIAILREAIKANEAERSAEPQNTMRSDRGADLSGLRPETVGGEMPR
jgi:hypothetical protein